MDTTHDETDATEADPADASRETDDDTTHPDTIDWHRFWLDAEGDRLATARPGDAHGMADLLDRFFERVDRPGSLAAVGCGPADCPLALAERHPDLDVHCFDAAPSAVALVRERAAGRGLSNVAVGGATLPAFDPGRSFDLVYCYSALHYVEEIERTLRELYDAVAPGGHLVFNYPNRYIRSEWDRLSSGDDPAIDRPTFRDRHALVLGGRNLLSYDRVAGALGRHPRSFWSAADADEYWARDDTPPEVRTGLTSACINPCVYVRKPPGDATGTDDHATNA